MSAANQVDVLVVSFNTRELLRQCLSSLSEQAPTRADIEVTVSVFDNGSQDGSAEMVARSFPHARLVRSPSNVGFAQANNALAASSVGTHLLLLNSDTVLEQDIVTPLLDTLAADERIAVVAPRLVSPDGSPQLSSQRFPTLGFEAARLLRPTSLAAVLRPVWDPEARVLSAVRGDEIERRISHDAEFVWATCWMLRRADVAPDGLFDSAFITYDEDLDYCRRLARSGRRIVWTGACELVHLGGRSSTSAQKRRLERAARTSYYRTHHGVGAAWLYRSLTGGFDAAKSLKRRLPRLRAPVGAPGA